MLMVGTISYFTGDEVTDELMRGYASLLREKGGSSVVAGMLLQRRVVCLDIVAS